MDLPVSTGLHSSELLSPPFLPSPSSSRLQGADHGKNQQQRQPNLHSDRQSTTARVWEPPVFIPTDRPEAASLIPITRGYFEEIVYILRLSVDCQMFWVRSPSHPCSRFCPLTLQTIVYQLCSLYFLNDRQHTYVFVEQPFIYQYLFFSFWTLCYKYSI